MKTESAAERQPGRQELSYGFCHRGRLLQHDHVPRAGDDDELLPAICSWRYWLNLTGVIRSASPQRMRVGGVMRLTSARRSNASHAAKSSWMTWGFTSRSRRV